MPKTEADNLLKIEISWLNKQRWLAQGRNYYQIQWKNSIGETYFKVDVSTSIDNLNPFITLNYSTEGTEIKDTIPLSKVACNFGGTRYFFRCLSCKKRVGNLYLVGQYFACRHCHLLTYRSRNMKKSLRNDLVYNTLGLYLKIGKLENQIKRFFYKGQPTRKGRKIEQMYYQLLKVGFTL